MKSEIGLIGLSTMGGNLARNIRDHGFKISVYNRTEKITKEFIKSFGDKNMTEEYSLKEFVASLEIPRKIIIMVKAGDPVDQVINSLKPFLSKGDLLIDCGNSYFEDTIRREKELQTKSITFIGCGVSGGEEGALNGPSLMPGGDKTAYLKIKNIFEQIAAKDFDNKPCTTYIGKDGSGHYVKMVHNGIEYGIMQLLAESYEVLRKVYQLKPNEIADIFKELNQGKLQSYLLEIMVPVLLKKDELTKNNFLIDKILDSAEQKGTGKWTSLDALNRGIPIPTITEAVFARFSSSFRTKRVLLGKNFKKEKTQDNISLSKFIKVLEDSLSASFLITYAEGYDLILEASREQNWNIDLKEISRIWQGGCIIRSNILKILEDALKKHENFEHLFLVKDVARDLKKTIKNLRELNKIAINNSLAVPGFASCLYYFDSMTEENSPANLLQGLRDFFGAHTYKRSDRSGIFHTKWEL